MKLFRNILLAIIPVAFIACNDGSNQNRNRDMDNDRNTMEMDDDRNTMEMDDDVNRTPSTSDTINQRDSLQ
jgi:hypothetical protein